MSILSGRREGEGSDGQLDVLKSRRVERTDEGREKKGKNSLAVEMSVLVMMQSVDPILADLTRVEENVDLQATNEGVQVSVARRGETDERERKKARLLRMIPRLGILVSVPSYSDAVVEDGELDVTVSLFDGLRKRGRMSFRNETRRTRK